MKAILPSSINEETTSRTSCISDATRVLELFGVICLTIQISLFIYCAFALSYDFTLTSSFDIDAAHHINLAKKGSVWGDTGWYIYGPFFYKIAHQFALFIPNFFLYPPDTLSFWESSLGSGFRLTCLSFALVYLLCLARYLIPDRRESALFASAFLTLLLLNPTWQKFFLRVYPDAILSFLLGISFLFALKIQNHPRTKFDSLGNPWILVSVLAWAAAFHVKIVAVFFAPGLFLLLMSTRLFSIFNFLLPLLFFTFVIVVGYPSNQAIFEFWMDLLTGGLTFKGSFNAEWVNYFISNYFDQALLPISLVVVTALLSPTGTFSVSRKTLLGAITGIAIPFAWLLLSPLDSPSNHYSMCLVITQAVLVIPIVIFVKKIISKLNVTRKASFLKLLDEHRIIRLSVIACMFLVFSGGKIVSRSHFALTHQYKECASEISIFERRLKKFKGLILRTPYTPRFHGDKFGASFSPPWWDVTVEKIQPDAKGLMISHSFISRFISPDKRNELYVQKLYTPDTIHSASSFAPVLMKAARFKDLQGNQWRKVHRYEACDFDFWIRG